MRKVLCFCLLLAVLAPVALADAAPESAVRMLAFSPGNAANQKQAQPTMDEFASVLAGHLGWSEGSLIAAFEPKLDRGLETLEDPQTALVMLPLPAFLEYRSRLSLEPLVAIAYQSGSDDRWSLVAPKGQIDGPASLSGWTVAGAPGYSPGFVREIALDHWGDLPDDVAIEPTSRVLSSLRKASRGEHIAVLLDREQAGTLGKLAFSDQLEVVTSSEDVPGFILCRVGGKLDDAAVEQVREALLTMHDQKSAEDILAEMRISRFEPLDDERLQQFTEKFGAPGS